MEGSAALWVVLWAFAVGAGGLVKGWSVESGARACRFLYTAANAPAARLPPTNANAPHQRQRPR